MAPPCYAGSAGPYVTPLVGFLQAIKYIDIRHWEDYGAALHTGSPMIPVA